MNQINEWDPSSKIITDIEIPEESKSIVGMVSYISDDSQFDWINGDGQLKK